MRVAEEDRNELGEEMITIDEFDMEEFFRLETDAWCNGQMTKASNK